MSPAALFRRGQRLAAAGLVGSLLCVGTASPVAALNRIAWIEDLGLGNGVPLVMLPSAAGAVVGVDEQRKTDSFVQTVTVAGDPGTTGQNDIAVTVTRNNGLAPRIEEDTVAADVAKALPDMPLHLGPTGTRNAFGVFGAVLGRRNGLTCIYAWQRVNLADRWINGDEGTPVDERHAMTIRYRLCRTAAAESELVAFVEASQSGLLGAPSAPQATPGYDALSAAASVAGTSDTVVAAMPRFAAGHREPHASERNSKRVGRLRRAEQPQPDTEALKPSVASQSPTVPLP